MRTACLIVAVLAVAVATAHADEFDDFVTKYNKVYATPSERAFRRSVFYDNLKVVSALNEFAKVEGKQAVHNVTMFMDVTPEEFKRTHRNYVPHEKAPKKPEVDFSTQIGASSVDWRNKGCITPVKNQGQCGSCWAFSATETVESFWNLAGNALTELSAQQVTSCAGGGCQGCGGGYTSAAYQYIENAGGLESAASYPYTSGGGNTGSCNFQKSDVVATVSSWAYAAQNGDETALQGALTSTGPISVCVDASSWQYYTGGVMQQCGQQIDHCVQAVGFNAEANPPYWIVRNSWTAQWGINGYIYVEMGQNLCAIGNDATYVTIGASPPPSNDDDPTTDDDY